MRIAHLSDIHFGALTHREIVTELVEEVNEGGVELVVISGDLTQRARRGQYEAAKAMIDSFEAPVLVVPGNHDVYPWWRPIKRWFNPLGRYEKFISADLTPTFETDGVAVLGINSAYGRTVKGGRIGEDQRERIRNYFQEQSEDAFRVLVVHHHLTLLQALEPHDVARHARKTLDVAAEVGVDMILCGHLHVSHVEPLLLTTHEHRMLIVSAGTATSHRGRREFRNVNVYNIITVEPEQVRIEERRYDPDRQEYHRKQMVEFDRDEDLGLSEEGS